MASSGLRNVTVTKWDTLKFSWQLTGQSIINNTSTISWKMELIAGSSGAINSTASKNWSVEWDDGTTNSGTNTVNIGNNQTKTLASGTKTITHNADGSKSFVAYFSQNFGITFSGSYIGNIGSSIVISLPEIAVKVPILTAPNFNDEQNPTITYNNASGNSVTSLQACISWTGDPDIAYRDISKTGTSYTFNLTTAERNKIRNAMSDKKSMAVRFYIKTVIDSTNYYSSISKTVTIVNATPTLSPTVTDVGTGSTLLTGNSNTIINGYNYVNVNSGATAKKGATIKSYKITCGNKTLTTASGSMTNVESGTFTFTITDSRGYTATSTVNKTFIPYIPLTCNLDMNLPTSDGYLLCYVYGNYYGNTFGKESNGLTLKYRYKVEGDTNYSAWLTMPIIVDDETSTYRLPLEITGLDYQKAITVQAQAKDKIFTIESTEETVKATPIFDWSEEDFKFNVPVSMQVGNTNYSLYGLCRALSETFNFDTSVSAGNNYSNATCSAQLAGNILRCTFNATRNSTANVGSIDNEEVFTVSIYHNGTINEALFTSFVNSGNINNDGLPAKNGLGAFYMSNISYTEDTLEFTVRLAAIAVATNTFRGYFVVPVTLNLDKFVEL